jgi:hypothetical protein
MDTDDPSAPGGKRPSSDAFKDGRDSSMSVYVERRLTQTGHSAADVLHDHTGFGLVAFTVGQARSRGWEVALDGGTENDPLALAHAVVVGDKSPRGPRRSLASEVTYLHWPPAGAEISLF